MASIKKYNQDGSLLVRYKPTPSSSERTGTLPDHQSYVEFRRVERETRKLGIACPTPAEFLASQSAPLEVVVTERSMSLAEFIGDPLNGDPGQFFDIWDCALSRARIQDYAALVGEAPLLARQPMREVTTKDVKNLIASWLICPSCEAISHRQGLNLSANELQSTGRRLPGCSAHHAARRRKTLQRALSAFKCAWDAAMRATPKLVDNNPFTTRLPMYPQPDTGRPTGKALTESQLEDLYNVLPRHVAAIVILGSFGFGRANTLLALTVGSVKVHPKYPDALVISEAGKWNDSIGEIEEWQKGGKDNGQRIITGLPARRIRAHIETFRSTPDCRHCEACRRGERHGWGRFGNPHTGCDFAEAAPLFANERGGGPLRHSNLSRIFRDACLEANLTKNTIGFDPVLHTLRVTAVTLSHSSGNDLGTIQHQGGWADTRTISQHYLAQDDQKLVAAATATARHYELAISGDLYEDEDPQTRIQKLQDRVAQLEEAQKRNTTPPTKQPRRGLSTIDAEDVRAAADGANNKLQILNRLGLSGGSNFARLERYCAKHGIELPAGRCAPA